jgi:hypothetical protein
VYYIAHDIPISAHLGIAKFKARLEQHFYCRTLTEHVAQYVPTCDACERIGKGRKSAHAPVNSDRLKRTAINIIGP